MQNTFSVLSYGAVPDGRTLSTKAFQSAVDACAGSGGGIVEVPAGRYLIGTIFLRSHTELHLCAGSLLIASTDLDDYNAPDAYAQNFGCAPEQWNACHLIIGCEIEDAAITGSGEIYGNGDFFYEEPVLPEGVPTKGNAWNYYGWVDGLALAKDKVRLRPGQTIVFVESRNIRLRDFTARDVTCWCCFFHGCENVSISGLKIFNKRYFCNTDGIDIDCCTNVTVSDCIIDTGDDAIAIRGASRRLSDGTKECRYITVTNCVLSSASSVFRIGVGASNISYVNISDIVMKKGSTGINIMGDWNKDISTGIHHVRVSNISAECLSYPLRIGAGKHKPITDIVIDGFAASAYASTNILCAEGSRLENVTLRHIDVRLLHKELSVPFNEYMLEARGRAILNCRNAKGLALSDVTYSADKETFSEWEEQMHVTGCSELALSGVKFLAK